MKKKTITAAFVAAIAIFAGTTVYNAQKPEPMSDIALINVEALASGETNEYGTLYGNGDGTRFCCCPGGSRTCGAANCSSC